MSTHGHKHSSSVSQNQKAQLASAYNELGKELSSTKIRVVGNYTLGKVIGEGAYGKVRLGTHRLTSTKVAIKQIPKAMSASLTREIHHHRRLHHPHVAQLYEVIATESSIWLVTELCSGGELFDYLAEKGRLNEDETRIIFGQLCLAVAYIHDRGIVHRDLKLENVLLDERCRVKLGDFGFTREFDRGVLLETFCGTTGYASPEMLEGRKYLGPEVDIWSLGIILYTLLTGTLPFDDDEESMMREMVIKGKFEDPEWLSDDARDLIKRILVKDPSQRLQIPQILSHPWFKFIVPSHERSDTSDTTKPTALHRVASPPAQPSPENSVSSTVSDATFLSASSELPTGSMTPVDTSYHDSVVQGVDEMLIRRNPSENTIRDITAIHVALETAEGGAKRDPALEEEAEEDLVRPSFPRTNSNASKTPPTHPPKTPARTKRRSVSSALSDHEDNDRATMERPLAPAAPQDYASLLNTPAPIIFSTSLDRELLNGLSVLGFDTGQMVHSVLSDACDSTGALWWMLRRRAERKAIEQGNAEKIMLSHIDASSSDIAEHAKTKKHEKKSKTSEHGSPIQEASAAESPIPAVHSAPELGFVPSAPEFAFVPPTPTVATTTHPKTPPRNSSPMRSLLSPTPSITEIGAKSQPSTPGSGTGSRGRKGRSGSISIMQRATTALEAAGLVRKKSSEAVREEKEREKEREKAAKELERRLTSTEESRSSHGSSSSRLMTKSPPLKATKDALTPATPAGDSEAKSGRSQVGSPWVIAGSSYSPTHSPTPTASPGDTLTSLPDLGDHGGKMGHRSRASLLTAFRMWFHEDRKGKRKGPATGTGAPRGMAYGHSMQASSTANGSSPSASRTVVKRRTSGGGARASRKHGYHSKRHSTSSRRSSSANSRRSSTTSMQMIIDSSPNGFDLTTAISRQRSDVSRRSYGSHTPNSERGEYPSRPSSVQSITMHRHRKSPSASSAGSLHNMSRTASPLPNYHRRGGSGSSTRVVRQSHSSHGTSGRPTHGRSNSNTSSVHSRNSSRRGSFYEQSESERTASPFRTRLSLDETVRRGGHGNSTFIAQKRQTPFGNPVNSVGRSSWKKSWGLEPPGWQSRSAHMPIEVLAISPAGDGPISIRDVFSGRQNLNMGDEDEWVDEDDDTSPFLGGLGQMASSTSGPPSQAQAMEPFLLSPPPRINNGRSSSTPSTSKRNPRTGAGSSRRHKSGHSPVGRSSPLPAETTFEDNRVIPRRQLPNGRSTNTGYHAPVIQEEDENEE
ncbi:Pkinase-domain-containing protein [Neolentinus lepideus HHB14362 ss-1]|uniref:non-specific serine/threonine protein kinase n=1 Tax=Neolentinus lepideus HHB14362 ss-1 TaxID=1314782 RepID=A0A165SYD3_9AGAM|nr:Pkinase-domain-containing protein [Neolentinus lepideus HHB14362 ss-1]